MRRRVLLVLDGVEPLQHGTDAQLGELKDQACAPSAAFCVHAAG